MKNGDRRPRPDSGHKLLASVLLAAAMLVSVIVAGSSSVHADPAAIEGVPTITDGDTIRIGGTRIRLNGIDAPEHGAMCAGQDMGAEAGRALDALVAHRSVSCIVSGQDRYGRDVATCAVAGEDIARAMVHEGWARDWPRYSHGAYSAPEAEARAAHAGVWSRECPGLWGNRNYSQQ